MSNTLPKQHRIMANHIEKRRTSLEGLLHDIYDDWSLMAHCSLDTEPGTDTSTSYFSDHFTCSPLRRSASVRRSMAGRRTMSFGIAETSNQLISWVDDELGIMRKFDEPTLWSMSIAQLSQLIGNLRAEVGSTSLLLIKYLKRRDQRKSRMMARCNVMTAILQALSPKRSVDAKLQFTLEPPAGENGYDQWLNAMRSVAQLPDGMPPHFRKRLWLTLADHYVKTAHIDWEETSRRAFNDRMNDDDDELSLQIVKDLHRTGWSGLNRDLERVLLKRVLLAYARFNKTIGYCQGFNVIAALILEVMEYNEEPALKVMIMLIEHVLPSGYFDQTLRALSVDMAVLRDLVHQRLPKLSTHLDYLMLSSESEFEPPLTNVFSMQWFLTLFATCLPKQAVFRIWDSLMLEGSEILLRAALAIWAKIGRRIYKAKSADSYYTIMGEICQELLHMNNDQCNDLMQVIYTMAEFPYPGLSELRDKYTWNIQPFSSAFRLLRQQVVSILKSDDENGSDLVTNSPKQGSSGTGGFLTPPAQGSSRASTSAPSGSASDLSKLEKQYKLMRQRQKQAAIILQNALASSTNRKPTNIRSTVIPSNNAVASNGANATGNSDVFNHLYLNSATSRIMSTMNGAVPLASRVVQPSGHSRASPASASKPRSSRMRSDDSGNSTDASTIVPAGSLCSPPSSPLSVGTGSVSTPTSSGGGSTPGLWTPLCSPWQRPIDSATGRSRSHSVGAIRGVQRSGAPLWRSCPELPAAEGNIKLWADRTKRTLEFTATNGNSMDNVGVASRMMRAQSYASESGHRYKRPPPLDLKVFTGNAPNQVDPAGSISQRPRSTSSSSASGLISTTTNGTTATSSQAHASMLKKSKAILASISSIEEEETGEKRRPSNAMRNPFPVKRQTALIERGKRLGLYS